MPTTLKSDCPPRFHDDGFENCVPTPNQYPLPISITLSIFSCASGFHSDGNRNCIDPAHTPIPNPTCHTGYKDDGYGNYFTLHVPTFCVSG